MSFYNLIDFMFVMNMNSVLSSMIILMLISMHVMLTLKRINNLEKFQHNLLINGLFLFLILFGLYVIVPEISFTITCMYIFGCGIFTIMKPIIKGATK